MGTHGEHNQKDSNLHRGLAVKHRELDSSRRQHNVDQRINKGRWRCSRAGRVFPIDGPFQDDEKNHVTKQQGHENDLMEKQAIEMWSGLFVHIRLTHLRNSFTKQIKLLTEMNGVAHFKDEAEHHLGITAGGGRVEAMYIPTTFRKLIYLRNSKDHTHFHFHGVEKQQFVGSVMPRGINSKRIHVLIPT